MKLRKVLAAFAAAAVAASSVALSAFAANTPTNATEAGKFACLISNDSTVAMCATKEDAVKVTGVNVVLECKDKEFEASVNGGSDYYGGTLLFFSDSVAWNASNQHDWSIQEGVKELTLKPTGTRYQYEMGFNVGKTVFSASDTYAYAALQDYSGSADMAIIRYELLDKDGNVLYELDADPSKPILSTPGKAVDNTKPADPVDEPTTPDEPTATEESTASDEPTAEPEETEEIEETVEPAETEEYVEPAETEEYVESEETEEFVEPVDDANPADDNGGSGANSNAAANNASANTDSKGSPDTGVAGVAAAAGVAALAGVAVVAARKRK